MSGAIPIHLILEEGDSHLNVDFEYDPNSDSISDLAAELTTHLGLPPPKTAMIQKIIETEVEKAKSEMIKSQKPDFSSDDEPIDDPEYHALIERQKKEIAAMDQRHLLEQNQYLQNTSRQPSSGFHPPSFHMEDLLSFN